MGYRSDVAYLIAGEKEAMLGALAEIRLGYPNIQRALDGDEDGDDPAIITETKFMLEGEAAPVITIALKLENVKWYDSYEYVQNHAALWAFFEEREDSMKIGGQFTRIGEEDDDIEEKHFGGYDFDIRDIFHLQRSIAVDDPKVFDAAHDIRRQPNRA